MVITISFDQSSLMYLGSWGVTACIIPQFLHGFLNALAWGGTQPWMRRALCSFVTSWRHRRANECLAAEESQRAILMVPGESTARRSSDDRSAASIKCPSGRVEEVPTALGLTL
eukprot:CAMPEP_0174753494 /NCGR_PEP_ID=MMETSP1094-20130205/104139_1 /TAXON_ID=156173 /ORGANISM="Chrysochromulina brevifilum, Strain UTEX LB 985" /LENGTH=113 /DNA_ID=CAMNT_0015959267 /DNA_START=30 /DNA_END=371 /DNA_ORIENTATION=-